MEVSTVSSEGSGATDSRRHADMTTIMRTPRTAQRKAPGNWWRGAGHITCEVLPSGHLPETASGRVTSQTASGAGPQRSVHRGKAAEVTGRGLSGTRDNTATFDQLSGPSRRITVMPSANGRRTVSKSRREAAISLKRRMALVAGV